MKNDLTVFIVDDDPFWASLLKEMLAELGFANVSTFSKGSDCINNLNKHPKLVFLDHQLEDSDGLKILQEIKQFEPHTCVVFCTAHMDFNVAVNAMKNGSAEYLLKANATIGEVGEIIKGLNTRKAFADKIF